MELAPVGRVVWLDRGDEGPLAQPRYDAIVVLGCRVRPDGTPSPSLARRARAGAALWSRGHAERLVLSGGGAGPTSEAKVAARVAEDEGVPASVLTLEEASSRTESNVTCCLDLLGADARVLVVTDAFHLPRAEWLFARRFEAARGIGVVGSRRQMVRGAVRELGSWARLSWLRARSALFAGVEAIVR
ncbi:MAG: YdcF family protein [Sandaracinaceae bacterium]